MATKKAARTAASSAQILESLQQNLRRLQEDADATLSRTRRRRAPRVGAEGQRTVERLVGEAHRVRLDLQARAVRTSKSLEVRAERLVGAVEREARRRLAPLLKQLNLPTREEVDGLTKRLAELERKIRKRPD